MRILFGSTDGLRAKGSQSLTIPLNDGRILAMAVVPQPVPRLAVAVGGGSGPGAPVRGATVQLAAGKTRMEALRCLKRRLSDVVYRHLAADAKTLTDDPDEHLDASPEGHFGAALQSSAVDSHPNINTSDQPLPGPASTTLPARAARRKTPNSKRLEPAH